MSHATPDDSFGTFAGASADLRTLLNFKVSPAVLRRVLPTGWELAPTSGLYAGSNLRVTFVVPLSGNDATGKAFPIIRYVIFSIPARKEGSDDEGHLMLFTGLTNGGRGPYDTNVNAKETISFAAQFNGSSAVHNESWEFVGDDGSTVSLQLEYARGLVAENKDVARVYSHVNPGFFRNYAYNEGVDVVKGPDVPAERLQRFAFLAKGGRFGQLFDGSEELVSVLSLPWYNRRIFLPAAARP